MTYKTEAPLGTAAKITVPVKVRYCLYARKSTEQEDKQILSIDSQIAEMEKLAVNEGLEAKCRIRFLVFLFTDFTLILVRFTSDDVDVIISFK